MSDKVLVSYRTLPDGNWVRAELHGDPFEILEQVSKRMFPNAAPQAPCTARRQPELPGETRPTATDATDPRAGPPSKSTEGNHRLPAQPAAPPAGVRDTSLAAYRAIEWDGRLTKQQRAVTQFFLANKHRSYTRQELSQATGLPINVICGRVNELMHAPLEFLVEIGKRRCRVTDERAAALELRRTDFMQRAA